MASLNVYEMVTERIIKQLEQGTIPWQKPWTGVRSGAFNRVRLTGVFHFFSSRLPGTIFLTALCTVKHSSIIISALL